MTPSREKLVIVNSLSPGDILMMTCAIRSLHLAHPEKFYTDTRTPCQEIFFNNPYITPLNCGDQTKELQIIEELKKDLNREEPIEHNGVKYLIAHYPEIHRSGTTGAHFSDGHRLFLEQQLKLKIPATGMNPDIFLHETELKSTNPLHKFSDYRGRYWVINAGIKNDYTLKWYDHYQEVVDLMKNKVQFVQIGQTQHNHPALNGVIDMRGKTNLRQLFRLMYDADGAVSCVSLPMVVMAAFKKPCVVVSGAREGVRWQINPDHAFLHRNGMMSCATYDGCWKSKLDECVNRHKQTGQPMCMELIQPEEICRAIELYYLGGRLESEKVIEMTEKPTLSMEAGHVGTVTATKTEIEELLKNDGNTITIPKTKIGINLNSVELKQIATASIFNVLRILQKYNPQDKYYDAYKWHYNKRGPSFVDLYHVAWWLGSTYQPKRILEIGCRTGVSLCQLLSSYHTYDGIEEITLCDIFAEQGSPDQVLSNLEALNIPVRDKVEFRVGSSLDEMPKLIAEGKLYDYLVVDGCHDKNFATADLENAVKLCDKGGVILMDDLSSDGCSLQDVWDDFKSRHASEFEFQEDNNGKGIGIARKK